MDLENIILKYALKNAFDYGKANPKFVIPKVIGELKRLGIDFDKSVVIKEAQRIVEEVNKLTREEIEERIRSFTFEKKEEKKKIYDMPNAITRFAPEPSGYLHIGHAKAIFLSYEISKQNNGRFILRFDDTNPKNEKQEYVDAIKEDLEWLEVKWDKESYTSDNMELFYEKAKELISKGFIYITTAKGEEIKKSRITKKPLKDRFNSVEKNLELFERMLNNEFDEGEAVALWKGDLESPNTALRDPAMFRIIKHPHYRQGTKYVVWPSYDFAVSIMDSLEVTLAMRSKEYELREKLYYDILDKLGMRKPVLLHFSRLKIKNGVVSKRKITPLVEKGIVSGWDDPRLLTLRGLKRRGIHRLAIKNFVLRFGLGKQEKVVDLEFLLKENRKVLDPIAKRIMFVRNPVKVKIDFEGEVKLKLHPSENLGERSLEVKNHVFVEKQDFEKYERANLKGIGCFNLRTGKREENCNKTIHWVNKEKKAVLWITHPLLTDSGEINPNSLEVVEGFVEPYFENLKEKEIVQLERIGFAILDNKEKGIFILSS